MTIGGSNPIEGDSFELIFYQGQEKWMFLVVRARITRTFYLPSIFIGGEGSKKK